MQRAAGNRAVQGLLQTLSGAEVAVQRLAGGAAAPVVQREDVDGVEITRDAAGGYATWEDPEGTRWHLNTRLGGVVKGKQVYHVTRETSPKGHYFFTLDAGVISDSSPGGKQKGARKFSTLPSSVQAFVRKNIDALLPPR